MQKKPTLYEKVLKSLLNKLIPELINLKEELGIGEVIIYKNRYSINDRMWFCIAQLGNFGRGVDLYYDYVEKFHISDFDKNTNIFYGNADFFIFSNAVLQRIKELRKQKEEIIEIINFRPTYKRIVLTEKYLAEKAE